MASATESLDQGLRHMNNAVDCLTRAALALAEVSPRLTDDAHAVLSKAHEAQAAVKRAHDALKGVA